MIVSPKIALGLRAETGATDHLKFGGITVRIDALERGIRVEPPILRDFPRTVADYAP